MDKDPGSLAERIGQAGWVARGVSYVVLGIITIRLVAGAGLRSEDADQVGALVAVSDAPGGSVLLVFLALGLGIFAIWQAAQLLGLSGSGLDVWLERLSKIIGIAFYGSLVATAIELLTRGTSSEGSWTVDRLSAWALQHWFGRVAVVGAGVIVILISARRGRRTVTGDLDDHLDLNDADQRERQLIEWSGRIGEVGRAVSFLIIGWFLAYAGVVERSDAAGGLDESLVRASTNAFGSILVVVTGTGFVLYGTFSILSARHRSLELTE